MLAYFVKLRNEEKFKKKNKNNATLSHDNATIKEREKHFVEPFDDDDYNVKTYQGIEYLLILEKLVLQYSYSITVFP